MWELLNVFFVFTHSLLKLQHTPPDSIAKHTRPPPAHSGHPPSLHLTVQSPWDLGPLVTYWLWKVLQQGQCNHRYAPSVHCADWNNLHLPCLSLPKNRMWMIEGLSPKMSHAVVIEEPLRRGTLIVTNDFASIKPCLYCTLPRLRMPNSSGYYHAASPSEIHTIDSLCIPMATSEVASHLVHLGQRTSTSRFGFVFSGENQ